MDAGRRYGRWTLVSDLALPRRWPHLCAVWPWDRRRRQSRARNLRPLCGLACAACEPVRLAALPAYVSAAERKAALCRWLYGGAAGAVPGVTDPVTGGFSAIPATAQYAQRDQAASVMLPPAQAPRFPTVGGGDPATADVAILDMTPATPTFAPAPSANFARMHANAVILPDRTVHVSGGSGIGEDPMTAGVASAPY